MTTTLKNMDNFKNFDWDLTKIFYFVAKLGGYSRASKTLGVLQPTLTRQVQILEKQLGFPLFMRHMTKGVTPTRKGEELLAIVEDVFITMKTFSGNIHEGQKKRKIVISTTYALASYGIGDLILDYADQHFHLTFEVIGKDKAFDIILHDHDMAIHPYYDVDAKGIHQEPIFTLTKKLYASREYLEKHGEPTTLEDLKTHQLIGRRLSEDAPFSDGSWLLKLGLPKGELHLPCLTVNSLELEVSAAKGSKGIIAADQELSIVRDSGLINILPKVSQETPYYLVCPNYLKQDPDITDIATYIKQKMALFGKGI